MEKKQLNLDGLQALLWNFASHRVITVASRVGLLRRLALESGTISQLAQELGLDELATGKTVRAITALGLSCAEGEEYRLAEPLWPYFQAGPEDLSNFIEHSHFMYERWGANLEGWLRGKEGPPGAPPDPGKFAAAMQAMGTHISRRVAGMLDLTGMERMLDVGGSMGHYARAFCRLSPSLKATILDRPAVAELGREALRGSEFEGCIDYLAGDYLETDYGQGYDLVLLANVLHQDSAARAEELVQRGTRALGPDGQLAVVEFSIDDEQRSEVLGTLFAINMRSFGDTYTAATIHSWMEAAGLEQLETRAIDTHRWLITGRRARL